jgi:hypothetical protein
MAEKKADPLEEVHFRVDEHERRFAELGRIADSIPALVHGGISALQAALDAKLEKLIAAQAQDVESDRAVVQKIEELCADIKSLVRVLSSPTTRTAVLTLPSGPATMTVRETRQ